MAASLSDDVAKYAESLKTGKNILFSLNRLFCLKISLNVYERYNVKDLAEKFTKDAETADVAENLVRKIQKMEEDSAIFRKPSNDRKRPISNSRSSQQSAKFANPSTSNANLSSKLGYSEASPLLSSVDTKSTVLIDVSKLQNLEKKEYDSIRPSLVTLSAKQLKSFMDRNPLIEKVGDGLFRRHCQIDCPEDVPKKLKTESWRTVHDVFINWKLYNEAKQLEEKFRKDTLENGKV